MKKQIKIRKKKEKGITLIALVITIIVLLILASVSIATLTGENGILTRASETKIESALGSVREALKLEQGEKIIDNETVAPETLLSEGKVKRTVQQAEDGNYYMYYAIKEEAFNGMQGLGRGNIASLKDVFLIDDNLNVKYIASNGKEYGEDIESKILEDETEIRFASKAFSEYVSKISGVTEEEMKFKWMKNQTSLIIADSSVDSLEDLVFFPNLTSLTLGEYGPNIPNITTMDGVENCTKLANITIIDGPNKDYSALKELKDLKYFNKRYGQEVELDNIIDSLKSSDKLQTIVLRDMNINSMERISELSNSLESINLSTNNIREIEGLEDKIKLKNLTISYNNITEIKGLENLVNYNLLNISYNNISDITPLSNNVALMSLDLRKNINIDADRNNYSGDRLEALNKIGKILDNGGTINLDIDKLKLFTNYKSLDLSAQNITSLEALEGLTELTYLSLSANNITLEDIESQEILKNMVKLETLDLSGNQITNIKEINNLKNLKTLYLNGDNNDVNLVEIEDIISNLTTLRVSAKSLKTIENCDINKITSLNLSGSSLKELPNLSKFTKLEKLSLNGNSQVSNFDIVSNVTSLKVLNMTANNLHGRMIDFSKLTNLTSLDLSTNTLWDKDLENLKVLKNNTNLTINLSYNSIIDTTALLELNSSTKINLIGNINLSQDSKDKLKARFGNNVTF